MLPCENCIHKNVCAYKEDYREFLDGTMKTVVEDMPRFMDMPHCMDITVSCKYFREDGRTERVFQ